MADESPAVRRLALKPKEIVPTEERSLPGDGTALSVELMHSMNRNAEARAALQPRLAGGGGEEDPEAIRVADILRQNLAAQPDPRDTLIAMPEKRVSRRRRDFLLLLSCSGSAALFIGYIFRNSMQMAGLALSGIAMLTLMLTWVLFGVMERY